MSKFIIDDPWLKYLEIEAGKRTERFDRKQRKALSKRIAKFRRSRKTKPFHG